MANLSDAFGTIRVKNVGKEFIEYLDAVQGSEENAYYKLCEIDQYKEAQVDEHNNLVIQFSTFGRWYYGNNLKGYLRGEWMQPSRYTPATRQQAYDRFIEALKKKDGVVEVEYTDSDAAMDWMGKGLFRVSVNHGEVEFTDVFDEQALTIDGYMDLTGSSFREAVEILHGDDAWNAYVGYNTRQSAAENKTIERSPADFDEWYANEYEG